MKIKILRQQGEHAPGDVVTVARTIPHGGNYDDACQYVLHDGTYVPESAAQVIDPPPPTSIDPAGDHAITRSVEELVDSVGVLAERWALTEGGADRSAVLEAAKAALTDAAWVVFCLAPEYGLGADRALLREVVEQYEDSIEGDLSTELVERIRGRLGKRGGSL